MKSILPEPATNLNSVLAHVTAEDLKQEIKKLEREISYAQYELRDFTEAHRARPYEPEYASTITFGFRDSIRELRSQVRNARGYLAQKEAAVNLSVQL